METNQETQVELPSEVSEPANSEQPNDTEWLESTKDSNIVERPTAVFDPKRPHGIVHPPYGKRRYQQDGKYFDHKGQEVSDAEA